MNVVVIGAQWGDEGKGKIVDYLAEDAKYVVDNLKEIVAYLRNVNNKDINLKTEFQI